MNTDISIWQIYYCYMILTFRGGIIMNEYPNISKNTILDDKLNTNNSNNSLYSNESITPSLGQINSKDLGSLPFAGRLGGEMVRRMIKDQEEKLAKDYNDNSLK